MAAEEKSEDGPPGASGPKASGTVIFVKRGNGNEGFGWAKPDADGDQVFVSFSDVSYQHRHLLPLQEGDRVQYDVVANYKKRGGTRVQEGVKGLNIVIERTAPPADTDTRELEALGVPINELTKSVYKLCRAQPSLSDEVIKTALKKLAEEGYQQLKALKEAKRTRNDWIEFACRVRLPDAVIDKLAQEFGPKLPSMNLSMDRQDRLAAELRGWYGDDYDNYHSVNDIDQVPKEFLIHDTTFSNSVRVCEEGRLMAKQANDTAYDGHLAWAGAPAVVFFQASDCGENRSMYPRGFTGQKGRFLVPPQQLGIHTDAFHMYFVQITESRRAKAEGDATMLQLHVLFLPAKHEKRAFCDEHFLMVNKHTFQPFHYDPKERQWMGFAYRKGFENARGMARGVMVNVCVAQDVPINLPVNLFEGRPLPRPLAAVVGGVIASEKEGEALYNDTSSSPKPQKLVLCKNLMNQGRCTNAECEYGHDVSWYAFSPAGDGEDRLSKIWTTQKSDSGWGFVPAYRTAATAS